METKWTPTPWVIRNIPQISADYYTIEQGTALGKDVFIGDIGWINFNTKRKGNADFIERACNSHNALVDALKDANRWISSPLAHFEFADKHSRADIKGRMKQALKQAETDNDNE